MVRPTKFEVNETGSGPGVALAVSGELDIRTVPALTDHVDGRLAGHPAELTLDLSELAFMDSSGLRLLIELHDRSRKEGWELKLLAPVSEHAMLVLQATGADRALPFAIHGE